MKDIITGKLQILQCSYSDHSSVMFPMTKGKTNVKEKKIYFNIVVFRKPQ